MKRAIPSILLAASLVACGGGGGGHGSDPGPTDAGPAFGEVTGTIAYAGAQDAQLVVGVFRENPPATAPVSFQIVTTPSFPQTYLVDFIPPGTYWVTAVLDIGRDSPTLPGDEDLQVSSAGPVTVGAGERLTVDLTLE